MSRGITNFDVDVDGNHVEWVGADYVCAALGWRTSRLDGPTRARLEEWCLNNCGLMRTKGMKKQYGRATAEKYASTRRPRAAQDNQTTVITCDAAVLEQLTTMIMDRIKKSNGTNQAALF